MKHPVPDRVKPLFVIFDIRAFSIVYDNNKVSKTNYNSCQVYLQNLCLFSLAVHVRGIENARCSIPPFKRKNFKRNLFTPLYLPLSTGSVDVPFSVHFKLVSLNGSMNVRDVHSRTETSEDIIIRFSLYSITSIP